MRRIGGKPLKELSLPFAYLAVHPVGTLVMVANGPGRPLAYQAASVAARAIPPDVVVSTGCCGALEPQLRIGEILIGNRVLDAELQNEYPAQPLPAGRASSGVVITVDRVAITANDKSSLRNHGAAVVEMEAAAVARYASGNKLPFFCIKAVSDESSEVLPLDFNQYRDREGRFSRTRIIAAALVRPWQTMPGLLRLDRNSRIAAESLGEFLADCRF